MSRPPILSEAKHITALEAENAALKQQLSALEAQAALDAPVVAAAEVMLKTGVAIEELVEKAGKSHIRYLEGENLKAADLLQVQDWEAQTTVRGAVRTRREAMSTNREGTK